MFISRFVTSAQLIIWGSLLFVLSQNVIKGQNNRGFSYGPIDCTSKWNLTTILLNASDIRTIYFSFKINNEEDCPFQYYTVTLYKHCLNHICNGQAKVFSKTIDVTKESKNMTFPNLEVATYFIEVEPHSLFFNGRPLCKYDECKAKNSLPVSVTSYWNSDINAWQDFNSIVVSFQLAPQFGFFRYNLALLKMSDEGNFIVENKTLQSPTNSCTFSNIQLGNYQILIRPYERNINEECICGNIGSGVCQKCMEISKIVENNNKDPVILNKTLIAVVCGISTILIAIIVVVLWLKRGIIYQKLVIIDKSVQSKTHLHTKDMTNKNVLLVHGADFNEHETAIECLADILEKHCLCNVTVMPSPKANLQAIQNQFHWIQKIMQEADKVIIVLSSSIHQKYFTLIQLPQNDLSGDMVSQLLDYLMQLIQTESFWKQKIVFCRFNYTSCNSRFSFLPCDYCYELPESLEDLILHIHNILINDHLEMKIQIPDSNIQCLKTSVRNAQKYLEVKEIETLAHLKYNRLDSEGYHSSSSDI